MRVGRLPSDDDTCGWVRTLPPRTRPVRSAAGALDADWVIVGAGYTGLAAARRLATLHPGHAILVVDAQRAGESAAGRNSGFAVEISPSPNVSDAPAARIYGRSYRLNTFGLEILRDLVRAHDIDCDWREVGKYQSAAEAHHEGRLDTFARHLAELEIPHAVLDREALSTRLGTSHYRRAVHTRQTVLVQPAALTRGLAFNLPANVTLLEESPLLAIEHRPRLTLTCREATIRAGRLILATNSYLPEFGFFQNGLVRFTLTAALTRPLTDEEHARIGAPDPWGVISIHRFGATVRYTADRRIMVRNTFEYWPALSMTRSELLERRDILRRSFEARFAALADVPFEFIWSGVVCVSRNMTAAFGQVADGVYAAGGCNAGGIARGTALGTLIADHASGHGSGRLDDALALPRPAWVPSPPWLGPLVKADLKRRQRGLGAEI
ncbi:MAG: NAD(P)/FAD-dependent oxidoreductase [Hyphomicrobiaceae bacterium]